MPINGMNGNGDDDEEDDYTTTTMTVNKRIWHPTWIVEIE